jgi:hypothetical protein
MRGAGADFHVVRLQQRATLRVPILLQREDDLLKCEHIVFLLPTAGGQLIQGVVRRNKPRILAGFS